MSRSSSRALGQLTLALMLFAALTACGGGGGGASGLSDSNQSPTANAGPDQTVASATRVNLAGAGTDADGSIASFSWSQTGGPAVTLSSTSAASPTFTAPTTTSPLTLAFTLTVTDNRGAAASDSVVINVNGTSTGSNQNPVANAGADQTVPSAAGVTLAGSGTDADGSIAAFNWVQTAGPAVTLSNANVANPTFTTPTTSSNVALGFTLTVTDNRGGTASDTVVVNVTGRAAGTPVVISGRVSFDRIRFRSSPGAGLDMGNPVISPARGVTVQALSTGSSPIVLGSTQTDANGNYSLSVPAGTSLRLRARAQTLRVGTPAWDFSVADNTQGGAVYALDTAVFDAGTADQTRNLHAASGWNGSAYVGVRAAAPFAILDNLYEALQKVLAVDSSVAFPKLSTFWSVNNVAAGGNPAMGQIGTSHYESNGGNHALYILGKADVDTDEFDDHVIVHEWGHFFESALSASDSIGGEHGAGDILDLRVAFGEGFGNALSGIVTDDPAYRDSSGSGQAADFVINVEDNPTAAENSGWYSEGSVQSILYDLYDSAVDGSDNLALGFGPIYRVMVDAQKTTSLQTSIFTFIAALKSANVSFSSGINAIVNAQRINANNIDPRGSTETNNAGNASDVLPIYTAISTDGVAKSVCSTNGFGEYNKLSNRRFLTFTLAAASDLTIEVNSGPDTDPDIHLHSRGQDDELAENSDPGNEILETFGSPAGSYVLEVFDYPNVDEDLSAGGRACLSVTVNAVAS